MTTADPDVSAASEPVVLELAWHLVERTDRASRAGGSNGEDRHASYTAGSIPEDEPHVLPPVWLRVLIGQSFAWRIRWLKRFLLGQRRRVARAVLRWMSFHPDIHRNVASGQFMGAVRAAWSRARSDRSTKRHTRPAIWTDIDVRALPVAHPLRQLVDLRPLSEPSTMGPGVHRMEAGRLEVCRDGRVRCVSATGRIEARILGPIDLRHWNPVGFPQRRSAETIRLDGMLDGVGEKAQRRRGAAARRAGSVECDVADDSDAQTVARAILELAAMGAPLTRGRLPDAVRSELPPGLTALIDTTRPTDIESAWARELHSIGVRREALTHGSARGRWSHIGSVLGSAVRSTPAVSVLLPSNRRDDVVEAARQVASQQGVDVQLVVGLHGAHMSAELEDELEQIFPGDLVVEHLDDAMNLGEVLNVLTERADRPLVAKWDDDDWYAPDHLADLVLAREYSGAPLVAKAAEFIYLEAMDLTIRRFATGAESMSTTVAGGTLLLSTADLRRIRWLEVPRQVDRRLIEAMADRGLPCYRTHGFGYLLRRRGHELGGHTWQASDRYFLRQSVDQRPGLDLEFANVRRTSPT